MYVSLYDQIITAYVCCTHSEDNLVFDSFLSGMNKMSYDCRYKTYVTGIDFTLTVVILQANIKLHYDVVT